MFMEINFFILKQKRGSAREKLKGCGSGKLMGITGSKYCFNEQTWDGCRCNIGGVNKNAQHGCHLFAVS